MVVPDDEIGVLADFDRADAVVDPQLLRRVDRHHRERLIVGDVAVAHGLGRLHVQPPRLLGVVGVDRDEHALVRHQRGVVRNGVGRFHLVAPPVGEGGRAGAVRGDLLGHLVALEHVLEGGDLEAHLVGEADQHQDLVGAIAVRVNQALAFEHLDQRVELQIAARREHVLAGLLLRLVVLPVLAVGLGARERVANDVLDALARGRKPLRIGRRLAALPGDVLAEGELDAGQRALEAAGRSPGVLPQRSLMTTVLPPMALALPCRMLAVVVPPARSR